MNCFLYLYLYWHFNFHLYVKVFIFMSFGKKQVERLAGFHLNQIAIVPAIIFIFLSQFESISIW